MEAKRPKISRIGEVVQDYCVFANHEFEMPTQGEYPNKYPEGAVIHYTASRSKNGYRDAKNTITYGTKMNHCYFCIASDGQIFQTAPMSRWGYHAGSSYYEGLGYSLSKKLVGIEICCAGKLHKDSQDRYVSWFGERYGYHEVVEHCKDKDNIISGYYHKFTMAQVDSLIILLLWMKRNNPSVFNLDYVLGHDEIDFLSEHETEEDRKTDPGGSLLSTMPVFRMELKKSYEELK